MSNQSIIINQSRESLENPGASLIVPGIDYCRLRELEPDYLEYLREEEFSEVSIITYRNELKRFLDWLEANPQRIGRSTFIEYRDSLRERYAPSSVNLALVGIRKFLDWLCDIGEIPNNPALGIKGIKMSGRKKSHKRDMLTNREINRLLSISPDSAVNARDRALIGTMAYGGLRSIEARRARIGDYRTKGDRRVLYLQGKGKREADDYIVISPELEGILGDWLSIHPRGSDSAAPLFCSLSRRSYGAELDSSSLRRIVKARYRAAGIRELSKSTHSLRHSAISAVIRGGGTLLQAQTFARHESPETTQIYVHTADRLENPPELLIRYE